MGLLRFTVRNQRLSGGQIKLVSDTVDYFDAEFDFRTEDWSGLSKWAHFSKDGVTYDVNLVDDRITKDMHLNLSEGTWEVKLHGTDSAGETRVTTETAYLTVTSYGNAENENPLPEIPLSAAEQIDAKSQLAIEKAESAKAAAEEAVSIAEEVKQAAADGEFNGKDGETGKTPEIQIGAVVTVPPEAEAEITIGGTAEKPILNFAIPQGKEGKEGISIQSIETETSGENGGQNLLSVYLTDGRFYQWVIRNGEKGESGEPGLVWKGEWDPETSYTAIKNGQFSRDVVFYEGSAYVVALNNTRPVTGVVPKGDTSGSWEILAEQGKEGAPGPAGPEADLGEYEQRIADIEAELESLNPFKVSSASASPSVLEIGDSVSSVKISWTLSKEPVSVTVGGETAAAAKSGSHTLNQSVTATASPNYREFAISAESENGKTAGGKARINFYNGIYYGAGTGQEDDLSFLTKVLSNSRARTFTATANEGEYIWYALPERLGECTFKVGGFEGGFELVHTGSFPNEFGYSENYRIYMSVNAGLGETTVEVS